MLIESRVIHPNKSMEKAFQQHFSEVELKIYSAFYQGRLYVVQRIKKDQKQEFIALFFKHEYNKQKDQLLDSTSSRGAEKKFNVVAGLFINELGFSKRKNIGFLAVREDVAPLVKQVMQFNFSEQKQKIRSFQVKEDTLEEALEIMDYSIPLHPCAIKVFIDRVEYNLCKLRRDLVDVGIRVGEEKLIFSESAILEAYVKAFNGLASKHEVGLAHFDIKPDNLLMKAGSMTEEQGVETIQTIKSLLYIDTPWESAEADKERVVRTEGYISHLEVMGEPSRGHPQGKIVRIDLKSRTDADLSRKGDIHATLMSLQCLTYPAFLMHWVGINERCFKHSRGIPIDVSEKRLLRTVSNFRQEMAMNLGKSFQDPQIIAYISSIMCERDPAAFHLGKAREIANFFEHRQRLYIQRSILEDLQKFNLLEDQLQGITSMLQKHWGEDQEQIISNGELCKQLLCLELIREKEYFQICEVETRKAIEEVYQNFMSHLRFNLEIGSYPNSDKRSKKYLREEPLEVGERVLVPNESGLQLGIVLEKLESDHYYVAKRIEQKMKYVNIPITSLRRYSM